MDFRLGRGFDFSVSAPLAAALARSSPTSGLPDRDAAERQLPRRASRRGSRWPGSASGSTTTSSSRSTRTPDGRKRYRIYGYEPGFEDEEGTDLAAVARGEIAITPIHFDLTDHGGFDGVRELRARAAPRAGPGDRPGVSAGGRTRRPGAPSCGSEIGELRPRLLRPRRSARRRRRLRRACSTSCARSRPSTRSCGRRTRRRSGSAASRSRASSSTSTARRCSRSATPAAPRRWRRGRRGSATC